MKKIISIGLSVLMALNIATYLPANIMQASAAEEDPLSELVFDPSTGTITGYNGYPSNLIIPSEIYGVRVKSIDQNAFESCSTLRTISIPDSVTSIGSRAFVCCSKLTSIEIPSSVVSLGRDAFYGCNGLTSATIPGSVANISESLFYSCDNLANVILQDGITSIGAQSFQSCLSLKKIVLPDSIASIGYQAFIGCIRLTDIVIPDNVACIGAGAFEATPWIKNYPDDFVIAGNDILLCYKGSSTTVVLPNNIKSIGNRAFADSNLISVTIPNSVTTIGIEAFANCQNLKSIHIPENVVSIGNFAFQYCFGLTDVTLTKGLKIIGGGLFYGCLSLKNITIPDSVTTIGGSTFSQCTNLTTAVIPNSVVNIYSYSFFSCRKLTIYGSSDSYAQSYALLNSIPFNDISQVLPESPLITTSVTDSTGQYVVATITAGAGLAIHYSLNHGSTWNDYTVPLDMPVHATIMAETVDSHGIHSEISSLVASNKPKAPTINSSTSDPTNQNVTIIITAETGLAIQYSLDNGTTWSDYSAPLTVEANSAILARTTNIAGVTSDNGSLTVSNIDKTAPAAPSITSSATSPTNKNVTITINAETNSIIQYSLNNGTTWNTYTTPFPVSMNGTVLAKATDAAGNVSESGSLTVSNIDKTAPAAPSITSSATSPTNQNVFVTIRAEGNSAIRYSLDNGLTWNNYSAPFVVSSSCTVLAKATDTAGNTSANGAFTINKITVSFNSQGGTPVTSKSANYNTTITAPANPIKAGYSFAGWYTAASSGAKIAFPYKVTAKVTLYSHWTAFTSVTPIGLKAASAGYNSVNVSWSAVPGSSGYQVYRATSATGTYSLIATTASLSYTNTGLTTGKTYYYKVRAYQTSGTSKIYSKYTSYVSGKPIPAAPINLKAIKVSSTRIKLTWSRVSGVSGYELYRATSSAGTYSLIKTTAYLYYTSTVLSSGKTYYYKIRAYRTVNGVKIYSGYTAVVYAKA